MSERIMTHIFAVNTDEIKNLNDELSRELVARLCRGELRQKKIHQDFVTWGGRPKSKRWRHRCSG